MTYEQGWRDAIEAAAKAIETAFERDEDVAAIDVVRTLTPPDSSRLTTGDKTESPAKKITDPAENYRTAKLLPPVNHGAVTASEYADFEPETPGGRAPSEPKPSEATACATCSGTGVAMVERGPVISSPGPCPDCGGTGKAKP